MEERMLKFECKQLGTNCNYVAWGNTIEEVKSDALGHVQVVHKYWLAILPPQKKADIDKTLTQITNERYFK
jgi:predicted small metal-binding protein